MKRLFRSFLTVVFIFSLAQAVLAQVEQGRLDSALEKLSKAERAGDTKAVSNAAVDVSGAYGEVIDKYLDMKDYSSAEKYSGDFEACIRRIKDKLSEQTRISLFSRIEAQKGLIWHLKGFYLLQIEKDYISGTTFMEKAEIAYKNAVGYAEKSSLPDDLKYTIINIYRSQALAAEGDKLFGEGSKSLEIGDTVRAREYFESAVAKYDGSEKLMPPPEEAEENGACAALPGFKPFAKAFSLRAAADEAAYSADYKLCAKLLEDELTQLQGIKLAFLGCESAKGDRFAAWLANEISVCRQRQKHFADRAEKQPVESLTKETILFMFTALFSVFFAFWFLKRLKVSLSIPLIVIIMVFSLVVVGIGTKLTKWVEGTAFFKQIISSVLSSKDQTGTK